MWDCKHQNLDSFANMKIFEHFASSLENKNSTLSLPAPTCCPEYVDLSKSRFHQVTPEVLKKKKIGSSFSLPHLV